ncbi:predicted protein [Chaetoceros tenuissimus]|uniref:Uncharacterized protein n=1 Tax=Chaetoceros tenuissimus TaxID=426638 RepID=A0AAD3D165_9STRA|nr:predicted protein [Chaetoceros tenuissimus]
MQSDETEEPLNQEDGNAEVDYSMRRNRRVTFETNLPTQMSNEKRDSSFSNEYDNAKRRESLSSEEEFPDDTRRYSYDNYSNQSSRDSFEATGNKEKRPSFFRKSSQSLTHLIAKVTPRNPSLRALFLFLGTAFTVSGLTVSGYYVYTNIISKSEEGPNTRATLFPSFAPTNVEPNTSSPSSAPLHNTGQPSIAEKDNETGIPTKGEASTKAPTVSPTKSKSPITSMCESDETSFSFLTTTGNTQDCAWLTLATDPSINQNRLNKYCVMEHVNTNCCKSCDGFEVDFCLDSLSFTFQITNGNIQECQLE